MRVKVRNGNVEAALRVFKKKSAEKLLDFRNKQFFEKPSIRAKMAKAIAVKRERKRINVD